MPVILKPYSLLGHTLLFAIDVPQCVYCGAIGPPVHVDHVIPRSQGGSNDPDNLAIACAACNREKGSRTPSEWQEDVHND